MGRAQSSPGQQLMHMGFPIAALLSLLVGAVASAVLSHLFFGSWKVGFELLSVWLRPTEILDEDVPPDRPGVGAQIGFALLIVVLVTLTYTSAIHFIHT